MFNACPNETIAIGRCGASPACTASAVLLITLATTLQPKERRTSEGERELARSAASALPRHVRRRGSGARAREERRANRRKGVHVEAGEGVCG